MVSGGTETGNESEGRGGARGLQQRNAAKMLSICDASLSTAIKKLQSDKVRGGDSAE